LHGGGEGNALASGTRVHRLAAGDALRGQSEGGKRNMIPKLIAAATALLIKCKTAGSVVTLYSAE
jgi:hypothetical protein